MGMLSVKSSCSLRTPMSSGLPLLSGGWGRESAGELGDRKGLRFVDTQHCQRHTVSHDSVMEVNVKVIWHPILLCYPKEHWCFEVCSTSFPKQQCVSWNILLQCKSLSDCMILNITQVKLSFAPLHLSWLHGASPIGCGSSLTSLKKLGLSGLSLCLGSGSLFSLFLWAFPNSLATLMLNHWLI